MHLENSKVSRSSSLTTTTLKDSAMPMDTLKLPDARLALIENESHRDHDEQFCSFGMTVTYSPYWQYYCAYCPIRGNICIMAWFCSLNVSFQNSLTLQMSFHISLTLQMFPELSSLVLSGEKRNCSSASFNNFSFARICIFLVLLLLFSLSFLLLFLYPDHQVYVS